MNRTPLAVSAFFMAACGGSAPKQPVTPAPAETESQEAYIEGVCFTSDYKLSVEDGVFEVTPEPKGEVLTIEKESFVGLAFLAGPQIAVALGDEAKVEEESFQYCHLRAKKGLKEVGINLLCSRLDGETGQTGTQFEAAAGSIVALARRLKPARDETFDPSVMPPAPPIPGITAAALKP